MNKDKTTGAMWIMVTLLVSLLVFSYLVLNLKSLDFGYEIQGLRQYEQKLEDEIAQLQAKRASLLNLERVETEVKKLGYDYPRPDQFIKLAGEQP